MARRRARLLLASLTVASLALGGCGASGAAPDSDPSASWELLWADEFDGPAGARPDDAIWVADIGNQEQDGWGNHELQYYTDAPENAALDGLGHLVITALPAPAGSALPCSTTPACPYTSARLTTAGTVGLEHGRIEVRAQLPNGTGLLPAIWMLGDGDEVWPAQGEIDIAEVVGGEPSTVYGTAHGPTFFNEGGIGGSHALEAASGDAFHVFAVEKTPDRIAWLVDGEEYFALTPSQLPDADDWVFEQSMHLLLNVAVGGDWPGAPDVDTPFPAEMIVDSVRIFGTGIVAPNP